MLGLGALDTHSKQTSALVGIFDLEGFTAFTSQAHPDSAVPAFLHDFISWLMGSGNSEPLILAYSKKN